MNNDDAKKRVSVANMYYIAYQRCSAPIYNGAGTINMPLIPGVVCLTFSVELYLKSILILENENIRSHELEILFKSLKKNIQDEVVSEVIKKISDINFEQELNKISSAFVDLRYFFENNQEFNVNINFLNILAQTLASNIDGLLRLNE